MVKLGLVIVKSAENQSVYCFREKVANLLSLKGSLKPKKFRKQTPPKMPKTRGSKGGVEKSLAFKELSMKSYGKLIILKSTGLWIEDHECRIICLG